MASSIFLDISFSNFISLFVIIPISFLSSSTIGTPDILYFAIILSASWIVWSFDKKNGSTITPLSLLLTLSTSEACSSIDIFLWIIPIPPCLAIDIAIFDSVTVSIPALIKGIFSLIVLVKFVCVFISFGNISDFWGINKTSSKVNPSFIIFAILILLSNLPVLDLNFYKKNLYVFHPLPKAKSLYRFENTFIELL